MDIQRYALMIALALVGWMTLVEWTNFRQEHLAKTNTDTPTQTAPDTTTLPAPADIAASAATTPASELPVAQHTASTTTPPPPVAAAVAKTITVLTDTLSLEISLTGGDIVGAALPKFHAELGRPDMPFKLLQQNPNRDYTAQSGLVGLTAPTLPRADRRSAVQNSTGNFRRAKTNWS